MPFIQANPRNNEVMGGIGYQVAEILFQHLGISRSWHYEKTWVEFDDKGQIIGGSVGLVNQTDRISQIEVFLRFF